MELTPRTDTVRTENMHKVVTRAEKRALRMKNVGFFLLSVSSLLKLQPAGLLNSCQLQ